MCFIDQTMKHYFQKYFPFQEWNNGAVDEFHRFIHQKLEPYEQEALLILTELNSAAGVHYFVITINPELEFELHSFMEKLEELVYDEDLLTVFGNLELFQPD